MSEVATNAVQHSGSDEFTVRVHMDDLWVEVCDSSHDLPRRRPTTEKDEHGVLVPSENGRGLELLELLAPGYEVVLRRDGKSVRFQPLITGV